MRYQSTDQNRAGMGPDQPVHTDPLIRARTLRSNFVAALITQWFGKAHATVSDLRNFRFTHVDQDRVKGTN